MAVTNLSRWYWLKRRAYRYSLIENPPETAQLSWQIIGQYNEMPVSTQGVNSGSLRVLTSARAKLAANNVTGFRVFGQGYYTGGSGGLEVNIGNDLPARVAILNSSSLLGISPAPVTVPNGSGLTQLAQFTGLTPVTAGTVLNLQKERILASGQFAPQTIPYVTGTIPAGVGRVGNDGTGASLLGTVNPAGIAAGSTEGDIWVAYGEHPNHTYGIVTDSIGYNNTDANLGDGGKIGTDGRTAEGGGMYRRGFRAAAAITGIEIPLRMMGKPAAQMNVLRSGSKRKASYPYFNTLVLQPATNDLDSSAGNRSVGQLISDYEAEAAEFRAAWAAGPNGHLPCFVIAVTPLPRSADIGGVPSTTQQRIADFCAAIKSNSIAGVDGYWDLNSVFSVPGIPWKIANTAQFNGDLLHPSALGHENGGDYISNIIRQAIPWENGAAAQVPPTMSFAQSSLIVPEGNTASIVNCTINIVRNDASGDQTINLAYTGSATSGVDYVTGPASVTVLDGQTSVNFSLTISGDTTVEPDETIIITATMASYTAVTATSVVTLTNDDSGSGTPTEFATMADFIDYMGSDLIALWDAADSTSLIRTDNTCTSWVDKISGVTLTAYGAPTYSATGFNSVAPAVVLNGSTQYFATASGNLPATFPAGTSEGWIYALAANIQTDTNTRFITAYGGTTNGQNRQLRIVTVGGIKRFSAGSGGGIAHTDTATNALNAHIYAGKHSLGGTNIAARIDGVNSTPASTTTVSWSTTTTSTIVAIGAALTFGATTLWQGPISLVMILGSDIPLSKLQMVEGIMNSRAEGDI